MNPVVAIVGRPNVGKSRLFNRMLSKNRSIVFDLPGTTRDTIYDTAEWNRVTFDIVDTGGLSNEKNDVHFKINKRVEEVVKKATAVILVCDYRTGIMPYDFEIANWLRKTNKQVFLVINKVDKPGDPSALSDFYQLGFKDMFAVSAEHGYGVDELLDATVNYIKSSAMITEPVEDEHTPLKLAFAGRPNVGKSSMINYIIGNEFVLVDDKPGTTRDPVELSIEIKNVPLTLIDTAGLKKKKDSTKIEAISAIKTRDSIQRSDIVVLVLDASQGVTAYDKKLIGMIQSYGKGCVIAANKWDIISKQNRQSEFKILTQRLDFVEYIPVVPTSAITGEGIGDLVDGIIRVSHNYEHRIPTSELNRFFKKVINEYQPISDGGKIIKPQYIVQVATRPPVFVVFTNSKTRVKENYGRFMAKRIRDLFGFEGVPVRVIFRNKD
ncbi:MAG: ribosome biogenesis GTPase Der [bacterium]